MEGNIIIFRILKNAGHTKTNNFCKKFYGQDTSCQKGKYKYRRQGLLDEIPHRKLIRGVLIIKKKDTPKIVKFLKEYGAEFHTRNITLTASDKQKLKEN